MKEKRKIAFSWKINNLWTAVQLAVQLRNSLNPGTGVSGIHVVDQIQQRRKKKKKNVHGNILDNEKKQNCS